MAIAPGARLGPYEIVAAIGSGGMGEVYRAKDTRLNRDVAIKVLPAHVVSHPRRRQRFDREAQAVAAVSHPHICALFDVGSEDGTEFLVMEHLEGETLARRLVRGALPLDDAVRYAIEIADALDHAHRHGIVHRDLKPTNIMLTRMGVKLLDFGLAKLADRAPVQMGLDAADALPDTQSLTAEGTILGTLQYMAPEQLEGKDADARVDLFAFGAILYEMITGRKAFTGGSHASLIASVLTADPAPMASLVHVTPPALERIVKKCLAKDPEVRWQTARDLLDELKWFRESGVAPTAGRITRSRLTWIAAALVLLAPLLTIAVQGRWPRSQSAEERPLRFIVSAPEHSTFDVSTAILALSPDGRSLAFGASSPTGERWLWVRSLDSVTARRIPGTEGGEQPFWSPDSRSLGFLPNTPKPQNRLVAAQSLKRINLAGGVAATLVDVPEAYLGTWNGSEVIFMFGPNRSGGLYRVPSGGRSPQPVTTLDPARGETAHLWPHFLPDGRHFLFTARSRQPEHNNMLYVGSLDSNKRVPLFTADSHAEYAAPGFLLYVRGLTGVGPRIAGGTLVAQPFDAVNLRVTGEPVRVAGPVDRSTDMLRGHFSVSQAGVLAYRPVADMQLVWYDRSGRRLQSIGSGANPALSPDGQRLAVARDDSESGASGIGLIDLSGANASLLASGSTIYDMPLWSRDGKRVVFRADRGHAPAIHQRNSDGSGSEDVLLPQTEPADPMIQPLAWSGDGQSLVYAKQGPTTSNDVAILPLDGDRKPAALLEGAAAEYMASVSPDARWIAYVSTESGKNEVYVRPFPSGDGKWKISADGGIEPSWRRDGREIFYLAADGHLMAVELEPTSTFAAGAPTRLFHTQMTTVPRLATTRNQYVASADGQRFLVREPPEGRPMMPITVIINWTATMKKQ